MFRSHNLSGTLYIDLTPRSRETPPFDPDAFERMSEDEAAEFECTVLARCSPEVGFIETAAPTMASSGKPRKGCPP